MGACTHHLCVDSSGRVPRAAGHMRCAGLRRRRAPPQTAVPPAGGIRPDSVGHPSRQGAPQHAAHARRGSACAFRLTGRGGPSRLCQYGRASPAHGRMRLRAGSDGGHALCRVGMGGDGARVGVGRAGGIGEGERWRVWEPAEKCRAARVPHPSCKRTASVPTARAGVSAGLQGGWRGLG